MPPGVIEAGTDSPQPQLEKWRKELLARVKDRETRHFIEGYFNRGEGIPSDKFSGLLWFHKKGQGAWLRPSLAPYYVYLSDAIADIIRSDLNGFRMHLIKKPEELVAWTNIILFSEYPDRLLAVIAEPLQSSNEKCSQYVKRFLQVHLIVFGAREFGVVVDDEITKIADEVVKSMGASFSMEELHTALVKSYHRLKDEVSTINGEVDAAKKKVLTSLVGQLKTLMCRVPSVKNWGNKVNSKMERHLQKQRWLYFVWKGHNIASDLIQFVDGQILNASGSSEQRMLSLASKLKDAEINANSQGFFWRRSVLLRDIRQLVQQIEAAKAENSQSAMC